MCFTKHKYPLMVRSSEGTLLYAATDLAAVHHRLVEEGFDRVLYLTDGGQRVHFEQVFEVAEKVGWLDRRKHSLEHVPFGLVLAENGAKLSSRDGKLLNL